MAKIVEVSLSDDLHATLSAEAAAAGMPFFKYCRYKLENGVMAAAPAPAEKPQIIPQFTTVVSPPPEDDRISRIEDAVARLTEFVLQGHQAAPEAQPQQPLDVDSIVNAQFAEAEAAGLTEHIPDEAEQQLAESGVRPLSKRPMPFSAATAPRHLQQLLG